MGKNTLVRNFLIAALLLIISSCMQSGKQPVERYINYNKDLPHILEELNLYESDLYIAIDKSKHTLSLMHHEKVIKQYPVVLGSNPVDDKRMEGDKCTPEGRFKIRDLYPHSSWSKFLWIDYPNEESWKKHRAAKLAGDIPDNASIGGEIGIHGVPQGRDHLIDKSSNWTLGCISLKNKDIDELYAVAFKGMDVFISH